jgi:sialidase-1
MFGISRGGLFMYNWARANISKISTLYGDGAVMDFVSWPCGCYGTGVGSAADWSSLKSDYGFASDSVAKAYTGNPYQNMQSFAAAKIPIIHVYGEIDPAVLPAENALRANDSLKAHGWQMNYCQSQTRVMFMGSRLQMVVYLDSWIL